METEAPRAEVSEVSPASPPPPSPVTEPPRGLVEWFTRRRSLQAARSRATTLAGAEGFWLQRARAFAELADRALDPIDPLRQGSGAPASLALFRHAAWLALLGQHAAPVASPLPQALAALPREQLLFAAGGEAGLREVEHLLLERTIVDDAREPDQLVAEQARELRKFTYALLEAKVGPALLVQKLKLQRLMRVLGLVAFATALTLTSLWGAKQVLTKPDLAAGKPWTASSQFAPCDPSQHRCGQIRTDIFFHTGEDKEPWVQFDLQKKTRFSRIEVVNRRDCCPDRAVPLVIEISQDAQHWREVARQPKTFAEWETTIAPVEARYVRARALKRTWLHLERFSLRER